MTLTLNEAQRRAVSHSGGPLLVVAGAGTGKTRVLTSRIAALIQTGAAAPHQIFAVTFTNKAAQEMRDRVSTLVGLAPQGLWIGTFHALAARMLRVEAARLGFAPGFTIYDDDDQLALVRRLLERLECSPKAFPPRAVRTIISHAKNRMVSPAELERDAADPLARVAGRVYAIMGPALQAANAMDFDDLLLHPLTLFREHPERLRRWQDRFHHVLVDEFQDTNRAQYQLVRLLAARHRNLCVVGDDDQAIYGWRGADLRNMLDFARDFPGTTLVRLEENYRSSPPILETANGVIAGNVGRLGKTLRATRPGHDPVVLYAAGDEREEADWVARELAEWRLRGAWRYRDMAVLYRTNAQSRAFEEAFRRADIPYRVVGAAGFYERREVKDLLAYLRAVVNPLDDAAFLRAVQVPRRGVGEATLQALVARAAREQVPLAQLAASAAGAGVRPVAATALRAFVELLAGLRAEAATTPPAALLERLVEAIRYGDYLEELEGDGVDRWDNVRELIASAAEWSDAEGGEGGAGEEGGTPLERFLAQAALLTSADRTEGEEEGITLTTLHNAKGLEWSVVVVAGLEDGLLPLARSSESEEGEEEERRLCYVGLTRARDRLYITWAAARRRGGDLRPGFPSRFLADLGPSVEERAGRGWWGLHSPRPQRATRASGPEPEHLSQDAPRYVNGERVRHRSFGSGTIVGLERGGLDLKIVVAFDDREIGTKELLARYAGLEREWEGT